MIVKLIGATRYLAIVPIVGLAIAAAVLFAFGGLGLISFILRSVTHIQEGHATEILPIFELLEFVHQFLIGTVLYITAMGLYQLFIQDVPLPLWMKTESSEDLETNLVGVTVVVLAIEFLGAVFSGSQPDILQYGAGIALPIAELGLFLGLKHRSKPKGSRGAEEEPVKPGDS
jgi:uncharacterized membrane protein YqhA